MIKESKGIIVDSALIYQTPGLQFVTIYINVQEKTGKIGWVTGRGLDNKLTFNLGNIDKIIPESIKDLQDNYTFNGF